VENYPLPQILGRNKIRFTVYTTFHVPQQMIAQRTMIPRFLYLTCRSLPNNQSSGKGRVHETGERFTASGWRSIVRVV
jgi:hypothetical protein